MLKEYTCIICPNGCDITAKIDGVEIISLDGAICKRGLEYVKQELTDPHRNIATSVLVLSGEVPLASVRLTNAIPKDRIFDVMKEIKKVKLAAPTKIGQVVIENILGLDSDVIVTKEIKAL